MHVRPLEFVRRFLKADHGASAVEFAVVVVPFITLILASLQTALIFLMSQAVQTATTISARYLLTGQGVGISASAFKTDVCNNLLSLFDCTKLFVDVETNTSFATLPTAPATLAYDAKGNVTTPATFSQGIQGSMIIVRVMYDWPVFGGSFGLSNQPDGGFLMIGTAVAQNEPYS